jgi:NADH-quinone oxidoreductase subunit M
MLTMYRRVVFGEIVNSALAAITDLSWIEVLIFAPLIVGTLALGLAPDLVFQVTNAASEHLATTFQAVTSGIGR